MDGTHLHLIQMPVRDNGVLAALRWIFGKPTQSPQLILPIHVLMTVSLDVKTKLIVETLTDIRVLSAIKMVAILTHSELVLKISSGQDLNLRSIPPNHSLLSLNSTLLTEPPPVTYLKSRESSFKTVKLLSIQTLRWMVWINNSTQSPMKCVRRPKESLKMKMISRPREDSRKWEKPWIKVWSLS